MGLKSQKQTDCDSLRGTLWLWYNYSSSRRLQSIRGTNTSCQVSNEPHYSEGAEPSGGGPSRHLLLQGPLRPTGVDIPVSHRLDSPSISAKCNILETVNKKHTRPMSCSSVLTGWAEFTVHTHTTQAPETQRHVGTLEHVQEATFSSSDETPET